MSRYLAERGFDVRAIRPPSVPRGTARLRLTVSASHTPQDIERLVSAVRGALTSAASLRDEPAV
jgi:8-amino-7-oxononanoate synthase